MKQSLEFKLGQHLTITPQLQQAIRLLQLSSIELQQEVQEALESNPLLEEDEDSHAEEAATPAETGDGAPSETEVAPTDVQMETANGGDQDVGPEDGDWGGNYEMPVTPGTRPDGDDNFPDIDARNSAPETLTDHLEWQLQMSPFSARDKDIAYALIDSINDDGYLATDLNDIVQTLNAEEKDEPYELDEVEAVLHQIQNFDPLGVGARDLAECVRIQLRALDPETPCLDAALKLATAETLRALANRDLTQIKRQLKLRQEEIQGAVQLIQQMNPRPGSSVHAAQAAYVVPDLIVRKRKGVWRAELSNNVAPRLRVNPEYEKLIRRGNASTDNKYLQDKLQQAKWFIKSLNSRNETLLKVGRTIVDRQRAFFDHGAEAMKPLVLHDIAEAVDMHESTISRVTTNKYMLTPRGIFELKYFFSSHVGTADGGTCSATAIRSIIKKLVASEPPSKPISDSKIAQILSEQGITVARRTVAKYRESMNIPPSNQRKSLV